MQGLEMIDAKLEQSTIEYAEQTEILIKMIAKGKIVILKNCFDSDQITSLKLAVHQWGQQHTVFPKGQSASVPDINFHRIDDTTIPSSLPHCFHQYGFGRLETLDQELRLIISTVSDPLLKLQNSIAGTNYHLSDPQVRVKFLHYPSGGGYLANHRHPLEPQRVGLIVSLSEWQVDYKAGGNVFDTPIDGCIKTSAEHFLGDVLLFRYDISHEIKPIDPEKLINWNSLAGKWSLVLELIQTNAQSNIVAGAN